jgi:hypothetical protein
LKAIDVLHGHDGIVHNLAFSNGLLVSSSDDQTIRVSYIYITHKRRMSSTVKLELIDIFHLCNIQLWDPEERKCMTVIGVNGYAVSIKVTASNLLAGSHRCIKVCWG